MNLGKLEALAESWRSEAAGEWKDAEAGHSENESRHCPKCSGGKKPDSPLCETCEWVRSQGAAL